MLLCDRFTHAPNIVVPPAEAAEQYATAFRPVVEQHPGIICYPTTGIGDTIEARYGHVELLDDMGLVRAGFETVPVGEMIDEASA